MIKENAPETVVDVTRKAFSLLPNLRKAIETLTSLRAVGPATASGTHKYIHTYIYIYVHSHAHGEF